MTLLFSPWQNRATAAQAHPAYCPATVLPFGLAFAPRATGFAFGSDSVRTLRYEELASSPDATIGAIADWIGLPAGERASRERNDAINTASLWQARQPVYKRSVERWRNYIQYVPELAQFAP